MQKEQKQTESVSFHSENFRRRSRYTVVFLGLLAAFFVIIVLNINTGNVHISVPKILRILFMRDGDAVEYSIIWKIRLPRILMAAILGGALSLSGFLLQTFFSNPIAGPFVLGISSGAKMVVALAMIIFLKHIGQFFIRGACAGGIYRIFVIDRIYLTDVAKDSAYGSTSGRWYHDRIYLFGYHGFLVVTFADDSDIVNLHGWSLGSFSRFQLE